MTLSNGAQQTQMKTEGGQEKMAKISANGRCLAEIKAIRTDVDFAYREPKTRTCILTYRLMESGWILRKWDTRLSDGSDDRPACFPGTWKRIKKADMSVLQDGRLMSVIDHWRDALASNGWTIL